MSLRARFPLLATFFFIGLVASAPAATPQPTPPAPISTAATQPLLSSIFTDHMVMQRGKPNQFWGWAQPGQAIELEVESQRVTGKAGANGRWQLAIMPPPAGGPYTVRVHGAETVELHDVLVGDVWLCGGQSNMELGLKRARNGEEEVKAANHPDIRLYTVAAHPSYSSTPMPKGEWKICTPENVATSSPSGFSAVAYYFALRLQQQVHVPIGLIQDCIGGTPVECWMSDASLQRLGLFGPERKEIARLHALGVSEYGNYIMHWYDEFDRGIKEPTWFSPEFNDSAWKTTTLADGFRELGVPETPSVVWFRREITLPDPLPAGKATLLLGVVEKMDTAYINGQWVGASSWVENPRAYNIDRKILKPGKNLVTIRVLKLKPNGGFMTAPDKIRLKFENGPSIALGEGEWRAAVSVDAKPPHPLPLGYENYPIMPTVLYRGMIEPIAPLALTGALWYQGEANFTRAYQYRTLLPAMIQDWRRVFAQGEFPFYIVSLPRFMAHKDQPTEDGWTELREAQAITARTVSNCGLAVTIDTGDADNIHPQDKKIVGDRLALCALRQHYGFNIPSEGPTYRKLEHVPGGLKVYFEHTDGGLIVKGDKPAEFSIAGSDQKWHWADAKLDGEAVIVSSPDVPQPVAVRYAWQANPVATLFNGADLPAVPFRTDNWKESTQPK